MADTLKAPARPAILLVDDVPTNLEVLAGILGKDYELSFALSGAEALELVGRNPPDLVLLDVMMPEMSGHEVQRRLRAEPTTRDLPVIFISADSSETSELEGLNQGADDYLVKPVIGPVLLARVRNLLARRQLELALRKSEEAFSTLAATAPVAILLLEDGLRCRYANARWSLISGQADASSKGATWLDMVHSEDRPEVTAELSHALAEGGGFHREFRVLSLTELTWVYGQAALLHQQPEDAGPILVLTLTDITQRKQTEAALAAKERHLETLIGAMDDLVLTLDTAGHISTFHNPGIFPQLTDVSALIGRDYHQSLPADLTAVLTDVIPTLITQLTPIAREFSLTPVDGGQPRYFHAIFSSLQDGSGWPTGFLCVARDISDRRSMEQELERLATTDTLTGVANRRRFIEQAETELRRCLRFKTPAALLMLDIDYFKRVNDTYGHAAGDEVLCHLARLADHRLRSSDLFGRLGGEEFAVLLPGTDLAGAVNFAEQFRQYVYDHPARTDSGEITCSVSIGVSIFLPEDGSSEAIFARADHALYRAKEGGRNRVEFYRLAEN
ncbi:hypothetical protein DLREEDagrD3_11210 [Denitratisoma sp. agr-D3]